MVRLFSGPNIPTPFGKVKLPDWDTPPISFPSMPDKHGRRAILHGIGEDLAQIPGIIPWVGAPIEDALEDMHHSEIKKLLTDEEYNVFSEYNKALPTSLALARLFCFKRV